MPVVGNDSCATAAGLSARPAAVPRGNRTSAPEPCMLTCRDMRNKSVSSIENEGTGVAHDSDRGAMDHLRQDPGSVPSTLSTWARETKFKVVVLYSTGGDDRLLCDVCAMNLEVLYVPRPRHPGCQEVRFLRALSRHPLSCSRPTAAPTAHSHTQSCAPLVSLRTCCRWG